MIPEIWIVVSTVCFAVKDNALYKNLRGDWGNSITCLQQIQITITPVVAKEGQTVKRLCDFVGHRWESTISLPRLTLEIRPDDDFKSDLQKCIFCHKKRRKIVNEKWEDIEP